MQRYEKILAGQVKAASRLIRDLEDGLPEAIEVIKALYPYTGKSQVIGITGAPGAGKSTLTDGLISSFRSRGQTIGILAIDPTSPFTGGAILGDRVRMQNHSEDPGVFIRSLATRGYLGGLSRATGDSIHVMDSMGKDLVLVETVGTGQQEVEIMNHAYTVVVVLVPGMGDAIQTIKAGLMEIADIFVINKADRDGADVLAKEIMLMMDMAVDDRGGWMPPVVQVGNINAQDSFNKGIAELTRVIEEHHNHLLQSGMLQQRQQRKASNEIKNCLVAGILDPIYHELCETKVLDSYVNQVVARDKDPHTLGEEIARRYLKQEFVSSGE